MYRRCIAALCCLTISLCACTSTPAIPQRKTKLAPPFSPLTEIKAGRKNIYLIVKDLDSDYWHVLIDGARDAGNALDCNVYYSGTYSEEDWSFQRDLLDDCIKKRADGVLISPNDSVQLAPKISEVYQKDIPVILVDTSANTDDYDISFMTDNLIAGQKAAEEMLRLLRKKGYTEKQPVQVGILVSTSHSQTINERLAGFFEYWTQHAPSGWEIITDIQCFDGNAELADTMSVQLIDEYPYVYGLFGSNNSASLALGNAILENGRQDIVLVAFDYSESVRQLLEDPDYSVSTLLQRQYDMGYEGVRAALKRNAGEAMPIKFEDMGVVIVNENTINDARVQEVLLHN